MTGTRDLHPSYLTDGLDNIHHYITYHGRSYQDLKNLQRDLDDLNLAINTRLIKDFKHIPEIGKLLQIKDN